MESSRSQKWLIASFFTAISLLFVFFIVSIALDKTDPIYSDRLANARAGPGSYHLDEKIHLIKDQPITVQGIALTYRGRASGKVHLELILMELDREYVYSRRIPVKDAKKGFRISDLQFKATAIDDHRLKLVFSAPRHSGGEQ